MRSRVLDGTRPLRNWRGQLWWLCGLAIVLAAPSATGGGDRAPDASAPPAAAGEAQEDAVQKLLIGNARFLCGKPDRPHLDAARRSETFSEGQHPFAAIVACADSRVPVEVLFDQGVGDLFVVRVAGNVIDKHQAGSLEYAVEHLKVPTIVVLGHRGCGAVAAALGGGEAHGNVASLVESIAPAVERVRAEHPEYAGEQLLAEAVKQNVFLSIRELIETSPALADAARARKLRLVGAVYDIETAVVTWLGPHPDEARLLGGGAGRAASAKEASRPELTSVRAKGALDGDEANEERAPSRRSDGAPKGEAAGKGDAGKGDGAGKGDAGRGEGTGKGDAGRGEGAGKGESKPAGKDEPKAKPKPDSHHP